MRLSLIAIIIKAKVCVICRSRWLRRITQTEALIIYTIMRKPNPKIVLLCIIIPELSSTMTKMIKLLVSVLGDVTSACIKLLSIGMTSILHI